MIQNVAIVEDIAIVTDQIMADLREQSAEDSQNSSDSSDSLVKIMSSDYAP